MKSGNAFNSTLIAYVQVLSSRVKLFINRPARNSSLVQTNFRKRSNLKFVNYVFQDCDQKELMIADLCRKTFRKCSRQNPGRVCKAVNSFLQTNFKALYQRTPKLNFSFIASSFSFPFCIWRPMPTPEPASMATMMNMIRPIFSTQQRDS